MVEDLKRQPLPPPHPELLKYFEPPKKLVKKARGAIEEAKTAFKVKEGEPTTTLLRHHADRLSILVPKRVARARKDGHVHARDDGDDTLLLEALPPRKKVKQSQTQSQAGKYEQESPKVSKSQSQLASQKRKPAESGSETEPESDAEELLLDKKPKEPPETEDDDDDEGILPTPEQSVLAEESFKEPGRIISTARPLEDFRENLRQGDLVTKSVEDLAYVIKKIVGQPFASKRNDELFECLRALRDVAVQVSDPRL